MSRAPAMPMYWDAYIADTTHLTIEEHGAYLLLLGAMWRRGGAVPDDDRDNARILGVTPRKWRQIKHRLEPLLCIDNGEITQKKLQNLWEITQEKINKNRANGAKGGRPPLRKNNDLAKAKGSVSVNPNKSIPDPDPDPLKSNTTTTVVTNVPAREPTDPPEERAGGGGPPTHRDKLLEAMGVGMDGITGPSGRMIGTRADMEIAGQWERDLGLTPNEQIAVVRECMATKSDPGPPASFRYFNPAMKRLAGAKRDAPLTPTAGGKTSARQDRANFDAALRSTIDALRAGEVSFPE